MKKYCRASEEGNIVHTTKRRKANRIGHILRRNCLLKYVIEGTVEGRIEVTRRRGRRRDHLLDDLQKKQEDKGNCKGEHWIALFGELASEEAMGPS